MAKFEIKYGLGGGFGGCGDWEPVDARDLDDATQQAYLAACEEYQGYDGLHGIRSIGNIMEEDEVNEEEAEDIWREERDSWITYRARKVER